jgi:hypothetical protein
MKARKQFSLYEVTSICPVFVLGRQLRCMPGAVGWAAMIALAGTAALLDQANPLIPLSCLPLHDVLVALLWLLEAG